MDKVTGLFGTIGKSFKNLTKREQVMIYGLVIIVVLAVLVFFILLPALTQMSELKEEASNLEEQELEMRLAISSVSQYDNTFEESEKTFKTLKKHLYTPMEPESLDELVTSFLVESGVTPKNLNMTVLQQAQIPEFAPGTLVAADAPQAGTGAAVTENTEQSSQDTSENSDGIQAFLYTVSVSVEGNKTDLAKMVDKAKKTSGLELRNYKFTTDDNDMSEGITTKGTISATISVFIYVDSETGNALPVEEELPSASQAGNSAD